MKQDQYHIIEANKINIWRDDHENRFFNYIRHMRRTSPRYYDVKCKLKIDFVTFSIYLKKNMNLKSDESTLVPLIKAIRAMRIEKTRFSFNPKYSYDRSRLYKFQFNGHVHQLIIAKSSKEPFKPYLLTIHDPTPDVLQFLEKFLVQYESYHVKDIENTFDFHFEDPDVVKKYLEQHTIVSWRGKGYHPEYDTFYGNNIRFAKGKGLRVYKKEEENEAGITSEFIRLEMRLKRPILKSNGINNIHDIFQMENNVIKKYFSFKSFRYDKLSTRMEDEGYDKEKIDEIILRVKEEIRDGYLYEVNRNWLRHFKRYNSDSYIEKSNYWYHFIDQLRFYSFLNGDVFSLSSVLMEDEIL